MKARRPCCACSISSECRPGCCCASRAVEQARRGAAFVGAASYWLSYLVKDLTGSRLAGDGLIFLILVGLSAYMWRRAQQQKVDHSNVNADWDETTNSVVPAEVRAAREAAKPIPPVAKTTPV